MVYCKKCVISDTRPGIVFDNGVCLPCRAVEERKTINWVERFEELEKLCDKYRGLHGNYYDCIIAVSGGKDSHFQVFMMKKVMKMNPLLVMVDNFTWTKTGRENFYNIRNTFDCDCISLNLSPATAKKMYRKAFEEFGSPNWFWDRAVYVYPIRMAINMGIPLVVYGENVDYEYGGVHTEETSSALEQIDNNVAKTYDWSVWDVERKALNFCVYPHRQKIRNAKLEPIYLSYFVPWDGYRNYEIAKRYGFKNLGDEWQREGFIEDYNQIDTVGYLVHPWLKYPKFGHSVTTSLCSRWIRTGRITRDEAIKLVKEHDHKLDPRALKDFLDFTGYIEKEFYEIVDKFYNRDIFKKVNGKWVLKNPIWR